jgi:hypothetical protein
MLETGLLHRLDLTSPGEPQVISSFPHPGVIYNSVVDDSGHAFLGSPAGLFVLDISDLDSIKYLLLIPTFPGNYLKLIDDSIIVMDEKGEVNVVDINPIEQAHKTLLLW